MNMHLSVVDVWALLGLHPPRRFLFLVSVFVHQCLSRTTNCIQKVVDKFLNKIIGKVWPCDKK